MRFGTNHFVDFRSACEYYRNYGHDSGDVQEKIDAGEVVIGQPKIRLGQSYGKTQEGRYWIEEGGSW